MRMALYGAGSLGTIMCAYLSKAGIDIDLINRNQAHVQALREHGAQVVGKVSLTQPVNALTPQEMEGVYDLIFLTTKQLENEQVVAFLAPFLGDRGVIVTLQNGLPELGIARLIGEDRVLGCVVGWGATLLSPGVSELTSEPQEITFDIGRMNGQVDQTLQEVQQVLGHIGTATIVRNFMGMRWSKLLINAAFSGLSAVCGCTYCEVVDDKRGVKIAQRVIKECIDVARADGRTIEPVQGKDIVKLLDYKGGAKRFISRKIIPIAIKAHRSLKASMLQDLEKGKLCEVDAINGVVSEVGRLHGVPTPFNDKIVAILHGVEQGTQRCVLENLDQFEPLFK